MGNLYEQTNNLLYIKDIVLLENDKEKESSETLKQKLAKHPKNKGPIDDSEYGKWQDKTEQPKKKNADS